MDRLDEALKDIEKVLEIDPSLKSAIQSKVRLSKEIHERQEKMKEEMMGKLKDLGNTVLGKFGMSLDNFQMNQDPETGSYSVNFVR